MRLPPTNKKPELLATQLLGSLVNRPAFGTFTATKSGAGAPFSEHLFFQTSIQLACFEARWRRSLVISRVLVEDADDSLPRCVLLVNSVSASGMADRTNN